jgi:hypothetical protein
MMQLRKLRFRLNHLRGFAPQSVESDLVELRRFPRYSVVQKLLLFVYFLVFGVVKLVSMLLLAAPFFIMCCALWRAAGRPEWGRRSAAGCGW